MYTVYAANYKKLWHKNIPTYEHIKTIVFSFYSHFNGQ